MTLVGDFVTGQTVPFQRLRQALLDQGGGIQEGVVNAGDLMVTQRGAGANPSVDVAAGTGWVKIDSGTRNGLCHVTSDAVANVVVTAAHATLPRVDQLILRYNDTSIPTGSGNTPTLEILTGTATASANLDANRSPSAAALPNDCMRLADILVPGGAGSITNANIRDRRPWARGVFSRIQRNQNAAAGSDYTPPASLAAIDVTNIDRRVELSGAPVRIGLIAIAQHASTNGEIVTQITSNLGGSVGSVPSGVSSGADSMRWHTTSAGSAEFAIHHHHIWIPNPGSYLISFLHNTPGGTAALRANAAQALVTYVVEDLRQNTANNTTTTG
jgi:hypothetical protein